jgi:hypothetical protein
MRIALIAAALVAAAAMPAGGQQVPPPMDRVLPDGTLVDPGDYWKPLWQMAQTETGVPVPGRDYVEHTILSSTNRGSSDGFTRAIDKDYASIPLQYRGAIGGYLNIETYVSVREYNLVSGASVPAQTTCAWRAGSSSDAPTGRMAFFEETTGQLSPDRQRRAELGGAFSGLGLVQAASRNLDQSCRVVTLRPLPVYYPILVCG